MTMAKSVGLPQPSRRFEKLSMFDGHRLVSASSLRRSQRRKIRVSGNCPNTVSVIFQSLTGISAVASTAQYPLSSVSQRSVSTAAVTELNAGLQLCNAPICDARHIAHYRRHENPEPSKRIASPVQQRSEGVSAHQVFSGKEITGIRVK